MSVESARHQGLRRSRRDRGTRGSDQRHYQRDRQRGPPAAATRARRVGGAQQSQSPPHGGLADNTEKTMYAFTYHRATGLRHAANMLEKLEEPKLLAGGQTLLPTMKQRLASPANLIDLGQVEGLAEITQAGRSVTIGAMARHSDVNNSKVVQEAIPALAYLAGLIGDPAVRHRGTIGGSIANNDPNSDYPAACLGLGATIVTNKRKIVADEFFKGLFETALEPNEIITK